MADIPGVIVVPLARHSDSRGWLLELFRSDELPPGFEPAMGYVSLTLPGVTRGPHEHRFQTDGFVFFDGEYELYLWENRDGHDDQKVTLKVGSEVPAAVFVPPGVVHAYRNCGASSAMVMNFPDRLYAGPGRSEEVDEIRHEADPGTRFKVL
ncbi:MAG: dTDP-4-dehydrorhamnose 3,5-epimerase family protein [Chthonomonadaceae bacterium]|nr:dTDP-4-dehydrorhamnose 3,5-epimerase family protein [Chthonomonadaceae bacterium]